MEFLNEYTIEELVRKGELQKLLELEKKIDELRITVEDIKRVIENEIKEVEKKLVDIPEFKFFVIPNRDHLFLKARLKNLLFIYDFFFKRENYINSLKKYIEIRKKGG